jgi:hypothetical protein
MDLDFSVVFDKIVRVRDGFATIVERVHHSPHGFRVKRSRVKNQGNESRLTAKRLPRPTIFWP